MPLGVAHILFPLILSDLYRHSSRKGRRILSKGMVLFAGVSGLLPDIDLPIFLFISYFQHIPNIHRTITHSLLFPAFGLAVFLLLWLFRNRISRSAIARKKRFAFLRQGNLHIYAIMFSFGTFTHILLDWLIIGALMPFFPLSSWSTGLDLISYLVPASSAAAPELYKTTLLVGLDSVLFFSWLVYEGSKKKIRDYI
ncbi:metal-dependent hydrolase [Candidatus Woesearchaeota archaeon]|nr:metal-dependent hydrolase [Candidatus Woesearchaeota archaeon]